MLRFGYVVMVGSLLSCLLFACGDKGAKPSPNSSTGGGTGGTGGDTSAGGTTDIGGIDGGDSEAGVAIDGGGGAGGTDAAAGGSTTVSYRNTIAPMMAASCAVSGCHNSSDQAAGFAFDTYAGLKADVDFASSAIQTGLMPISPGADLTAADKKNFQNWVTAGALNN